MALPWRSLLVLSAVCGCSLAWAGSAQASSTVSMTGTLQVIHGDNFAKGTTMERLYLRSDGRRVPLRFRRDLVSKAGKRVRVRVRRQGGAAIVKQARVIRRRGAKAAVAPGVRKVAVVLFNYQNDTSEPWTRHAGAPVRVHEHGLAQHVLQRRIERPGLARRQAEPGRGRLPEARRTRSLLHGAPRQHHHPAAIPTPGPTPPERWRLRPATISAATTTSSTRHRLRPAVDSTVDWQRSTTAGHSSMAVCIRNQTVAT